MAHELGLQRAVKQVGRKSKMRLQAEQQRTYFQLMCFEEGFILQRRIPSMIDKSVIPDGRDWTDSLDQNCTPHDVRIAFALDLLDMMNRLSSSLEDAAKRFPRRNRALILREAMIFRLVIQEHQLITVPSLDPTAHGYRAEFASSPCAAYLYLSRRLNLSQALFARYTDPQLKGPAFENDRLYAFREATIAAIQLFELFDGAYGRDGYYRYVHDTAITIAAAAAIWITDNFKAFPPDLASRARRAVCHASEVTKACAGFWMEHAAYLHAVLAHCCAKLPPVASTSNGGSCGETVSHSLYTGIGDAHDWQPAVNVNELGLSEDLRRLLQGSMKPAAGWSPAGTDSDVSALFSNPPTVPEVPVVWPHATPQMEPQQPPAQYQVQAPESRPPPQHQYSQDDFVVPSQRPFVPQQQGYQYGQQPHHSMQPPPPQSQLFPQAAQSNEGLHHLAAASSAASAQPNPPQSHPASNAPQHFPQEYPPAPHALDWQQTLSASPGTTSQSFHSLIASFPSELRLPTMSHAPHASFPPFL